MNQTETDVQAAAGGGVTIPVVATIFKGDVSYGRKGVIQRERKVKLSYVTKLRRVLTELARLGPIADLEEAITSASWTSLYYHHSGEFRVKEAVTPLTNPKVGDVVTIQTEVIGRTLNLDCSLRFFSEGPEPSGEFLLHSGNLRFFGGDIPLQMETIFQLLARTDKMIIGTPLFLKLRGGRAAL